MSELGELQEELRGCQKREELQFRQIEEWQRQHDKRVEERTRLDTERYTRIEALINELKTDFRPVRDCVIGWKEVIEGARLTTDIVKNWQGRMVAYGALYVLISTIVAGLIVASFNYFTQGVRHDKEISKHSVVVEERS